MRAKPAGRAPVTCTWQVRTVAVFALLLGLVAMHGLASSHRAMTASHATVVEAGEATRALQGAVASASSMTDGMRTAVSPPGAATALLSSGREAGGSMGGLCLAILSAVGLALLVVAMSVRRPGRPTGRCARMRRVLDAALPRPAPDLHRLCISRT